MGIRISLIFLMALLAFPLCSIAEEKVFFDAIGREVRIPTFPRRIVSLAPSITEILYYLGLEQRVVGVTLFSYYPPDAKSKPKVGSYRDVNVEKVLELAPDLVIATADGNEPHVVALLEEARVPVYVVNPRNINDVIKTIRKLGELCGVKERASNLCKRLEGRLKAVKTKVYGRKKPLVFLQINLRPIISVNKNTFHHDVIHTAGGINMTAELHSTYPRISIEEVLKRKPEVILISCMARGGMFKRAQEEWMKWKNIPAVRDNRVHLVNSDLLDRPSPRLFDGLEMVAKLLHPKLDW